MGKPSKPSAYQSFLIKRAQAADGDGFEPVWMPEFLFDFQRSMVEWSLRKGRGALFEDCGLGKTPQELVWAENIVRKTGKNVLMLAPLAVSAQIIREAEKFGIEVTRSNNGQAHPGITVTNYERLHHFDASQFTACVLDESSILKSFDGARKTEITDFMRKMPYRLLATATAAPNDFIELGTSSEALGYLGHLDMLARFFRNTQNTNAAGGGGFGKGGKRFGDQVKWRFKGHAEIPFWRWVCSWARAVRKPSDLGFDDGNFKLPPMEEQEHIVEARTKPEGFLFEVSASNLQEQRDERRRTIGERCERIASLVNKTGKPALIFCHLNEEGDELERMIPDSIQVAGNDSDDLKEQRLIAFAEQNERVLITKQKIAGWGLNYQHCAHVALFPSHSYEAYYQGVRRCWRFGQKNPVHVDIVTTEGERGVLANMQRKAAQADKMFARLIESMHHAQQIISTHKPTKNTRLPNWL